jgi:hypothetical protein
MARSRDIAPHGKARRRADRIFLFRLGSLTP